MPGQVQLAIGQVQDAPLDYVVPNAQALELLCANAVFDGSGAAAAFLPALVIISDSGHVVSRTITAASVAAGGSAEVTFAPFLRSQAGGGGGGGTASVHLPVNLTNPYLTADTGNSHPWLQAVTNADLGLWAFRKDVEGVVFGNVLIPPAYDSGGTLVLALATPTAATGDVLLAVGTVAKGDGESLEPAGFTVETQQTVTIAAGTTLELVSFALTPTLAANDLVLVEVIRRGNLAGDTLDNLLELFGAWLTVTIST